MRNENQLPQASMLLNNVKNIEYVESLLRIYCIMYNKDKAEFVTKKSIKLSPID